MLSGSLVRSFSFGKRTPLLVLPPQLICAKLLLPLTSSIIDESPELTPTTTIDSGVTFVSTQDTPFGLGNSAYFNGNGCIEATYTNENIIGEDDFTVECWVRSPGTNGYFTVWCAGPGYQNTLYIYDTYLTYYDNDQVEMGTQNDLYPYDEWHHIAVTRQSGYLRLFIDGSLSDERVESGSSNITSNTHRVGNSFYSSPEYFVGYMSNFRFIKGLAVYTQEFTPPTAPLDACIPLPPPPAPPSQTLAITLPANAQCVPAAGAINVANDVAWHSFTLDNTANIRVETTVSEGFTYDTEIGVYDSTGTLIGSDDDSGGNGLSLLNLYNLQPGTYYVVVGRYNVNFGALFNAISDTPLIDDCTIQVNVYEFVLVSTVIIHDTFTGATATSLLSHTPDIAGGQWLDYINKEYVTSTADAFSLDGTGNVYLNTYSWNDDGAIYNSTISTASNFIIEADLEIIQEMQAYSQIFLLFKGDPVDNGQVDYDLRFSQMELFLNSNGSVSSVGLGFKGDEGNGIYVSPINSVNVSTGTHQLKLIVNNLNLLFYYDNVLLAQRTASSLSTGTHFGFTMKTNDDLGRIGFSSFKVSET